MIEMKEEEMDPHLRRKRFKLFDSKLLHFHILILFVFFQSNECEKYVINEEEVDFSFTQIGYNVTIQENSIGKTYVTPQTKMGIYLSPDMPDVKYAIISGDNSRLFKPESRRVGDFSFLRVRTRSGVQTVINREQEDLYRLVIRGTVKFRHGPILSTTTELLVNVIDANDLSPLFDLMVYKVEIPENASLHRSIARVMASDADVGVNGEVYYSFGQLTETFAIHPTTGVVTLTRPLSFNEQAFYQLDVMARDRGPVQGRDVRVSRASLQINVVEVNEYSPEIELHELPAVVEHGKLGTIYAILYVTDQDYGRNGHIDRVTIVAGDPDGHFKLEKGAKEDMEYTLQVAKEIDRESTPSGFSLTIVAVDKGMPPRKTSLTVDVRLQDTNDNAPEFESHFFRVSVEECLPIHTPIAFLTASDTDAGKNAEMVYSMFAGNDLGLFSIGPATGLLSIATALDAETLDSINVTIEAQDMANRGVRRASETLVEIMIVDCNDNTPVFGAVPSIVYVEENQPERTSVFHVEAQDMDKGENGFISYSLANVEPVPFAIDHFTGEIFTKEVLDYELMRRTYSLVIRASDWGNPFRRETETIIRVRVKDVNDNRPQFERVNCTGYLSRESPVGTELLVVSAIDFDSGNIVSYYIVSGNDDDCFELDSSTGSLKTNCIMRGNQLDSHRILVTATDGVNSADAMSVDMTYVNNNRNRKLSNADVNFNCRDTRVTDELNRILKIMEERNQGTSGELLSIGPNQFSQNLHAPRFTAQNPNIITIDEGLAAGTKLMMLSVVDEDHGYNGRLLFTIASGNDNNVFKVDTYTGDIFVVRDLDREVKDRYRLNVTVSDMGTPNPKSTSMILQVNVNDVNDNAPEFDKTVYSVTIPENMTVNTVIYEVAAIDRDLGLNGRVAYQIVDSNADIFSINIRSGSISVIRLLDRETVNSYMLTVVATDRSVDNPLSSTATIMIKVSDINDNAPKFNPRSYDIRILEDMPIGTVVTTLFALDPDLDGGGIVRYDLTDGTDDKFEIDRVTGIIRLKKELNFDKKQIYNITAKARDRGDPSFTSESIVVIRIVDVNNNLHSPIFKDIVFTCHVRENQPPRTSVMQILATDNDARNPLASQRDYQILYSIRNGTGLGLFTVDSRGMIYTRGSLDRETETHYWLTVYAQDMGSIPLSSMAEIYVEIDDVNDNIPQTDSPVYYSTVMENSPSGTSVQLLIAYDMDDLPVNQITYDITSGNPQGFFSINHTTGLITTGHRLLDREKQDEHILEVTISDNGVPSLSSVTRVVVRVGDVNDEEPRFLDRQHRVRIPRLPVNQLDVGLYRVTAVDRDLGANGDIDYNIIITKDNKANDGKFSIHPKTGVIYALTELDKDAQYDLQIKAVDNGRPQQNANTRVILVVMDVPKSSLNPPKFKNHGLQVPLMESDEIGHLVSLMTASDADGDKIWYFITDGNVEDTFSIHTENGNILLSRTLDWESRRFYNLTVQATDGVHWTKTWVYVSVLDINDNAPQFGRSTYEVNVTEEVVIGTDICTVIATDADEDGRLFYTIHSAKSPSSLSKFRINSETGVITTLEELNHEVVSRHELTVMVRDQGAVSKRNLCRVIINVLDGNDHSPEFLEENVKGWITSSASVGTRVLQVVAYDRDKGVNAQIKYSIIAGNVKGAFNIDPTLGILTVAQRLNENERSEYTLTIKASDGGTPSLISTSVIQIEIVASNDSPPKFDQTEYSSELSENQAIGTFIAVVRATCQSSVVYEIVSGNDANLFSINPSSGVIFSEEVFDYEQVSFFNLTVSSTNIMGARTQTIVFIHITDVNDNAPVFVKTDCKGNISESAVPGSYVMDRMNSPLIVKATDADSNKNSLLLYEILETRAKDVFDIDPSTGAIRTKIILDRELTSVYEFNVQAFDHGRPSRSASVAAKVTIYIDDVNDSPPVFIERNYKATLLLPTQPDVMLTKVTAYDNDSLVNAVIEYSIVKGNELRNFELDTKTGVLTVVDVEDMLDSYKLTVKATDGQFEDEANIDISVDFRQTTGLQFLSDVYYANITENVMELQSVTVIQAVGHSLNEHLTFTILNSRGLFEVLRTSGVVRTVEGKLFDREVHAYYVLVVEVRDQREPQRVAHCLVNVTVLDVNDNAPVLVNQPYIVVVSVDTPVGEVIKTLTAIDKDIGQNGFVNFFLIEGDAEFFSIHKETGEIVTQRELSVVENSIQHKLIVEARDRGGFGSLSSRAEVMITVMDKATPMFDQAFYTVSVAENVPLYSTIITMFANSPTGGKLVYSIVKGDDYGEFAIDFNTGAISALESLDYESAKNHELTVRALDIHSGSFAHVIVKINVEDVNDHKPMFERHRYNAPVSEAVSIGTSILSVSASDEDSGSNALIWYQIQQNSNPNHFNFFQIDQKEGIISTRKKLDHELMKLVTFIVVATDSGIPSLTATATVVIDITDANDNAPKFDQSVYDLSISDQSKRGQFVTVLLASDEDTSDRGKLRYAIVGGNVGQAFMLDVNRGIVSVSDLRRPEFQSSYVLNVSVTDGVFTSFAQIEVNIEGSNLQTPQFSQLVYDADVFERQRPGQPVAIVTAYDSDRGTNGELTYRLMNDDLDDLFNVDSISGAITTKSLLLRVTSSSYHLRISATDGGGLVGYTSVTVNVRSQSDNMPTFLMKDYKANVFASSHQGSTVVKVTAIDPNAGGDAGTTTTADDLEYSLVHDLEKTSGVEYFSIDSSSGLITINSSLVGLENELLQFFARVKKTNIDMRSLDVPVEIYVMGPLDRPPLFDMDIYSYFVIESRPIGWTVATVKASSNDSLSYSIVPGNRPNFNSPPVFSVDDSGAIKTTSELDRETVERFELNLRVETQTSPALVAHAVIVVHVQDVNDNRPKFVTDRYVASVAENGASSEKVLRLEAHDADSGSNAEVTYEFSSKHLANVSNCFSIDSHSGWITSLTSLDREVTNEYQFDVIAIDRGSPDRQTSTAAVTITVIDQNDMAPIFSQNSYSGAVNEDALPGTIILSVTATDADQEPNNVVNFHISDGDLVGQFSIRRSGEIYVNRELDRESQPQYDLVVVATDGTFVSSARVSITILDANDNAPLCDPDVYKVPIAENIPIGSVVLKVSATDVDEFGTRNSRVEYFLENNNTQVFVVHRRTGIISTKQSLDRESVSEYHLKLIAQDGGGLFCTSDIFISLSDVNDNAPVFTRSHYVAMVPENSLSTTLVLRVAAIDPDLGINRRVMYSMESDVTDDVFTIDSTSGVITLRKSLDRETQDSFNLTVYAVDQGHPRLTSVATVTVILIDVNDNPPEFERSVYFLSLSEFTSVGSVVGKVFATSRDIGVNAEITYSIRRDDDEMKYFDIDQQTGEIKLVKLLDYEHQKEFALMIEGADGGSPSLTSSTVLRVNVTDENDNAPNFLRNDYQLSIKEDLPINTTLLRVEAVDVDSGLGGKVEYFLQSGGFNHFIVDPINGNLLILDPLDRETIDKYDLVILAIDKGNQPLTSTASVKLEILDVNDSPPRVTNENLTAAIQADQKLGSKVITLQVVDEDLDPNGQPFIYDIIDGGQQKFRIDTNGVIRTTAIFNRSIKDIYILTVRVFDNGSPPLYSDVEVTIYINEESTSPPIVLPLKISVIVFDDSFPGGVIGRIKATDPDVHDQLVFTIVDNKNLFDIDLTDGTLRTLESLDAGEYVLNVSVTDGRFVRYSEVRMIIESITSDMKDSAVVVRIEYMSPEEFVSSYLQSFMTVLKSELAVRERDIKVLSIQPASGAAELTTQSRKRRMTESHLDVMIAIQRSQNKFFRGNALKRRIEQAQNSIEQMSGVKIVKVFNNVCTKDTCHEGECQTQFDFNTDSPFTIITDRDSYVLLPHSLTYQCLCKAGTSGPPCQEYAGVCSPGLCKEPKICNSNGESYTCSCPEGRAGDDCKDIVEVPCTDAICRKDKPLTLSGFSYIRWRLTVPMERRLSLSLELKTVQQKTRIMHAVGRVDYSILEIEDGMIQFRFDCGSGPGLVRVVKQPVNDGLWHSVVVERTGKSVRIVVDGLYTMDGSAPGTNDVLNLDSNDVFFGAEVEMLAPGMEEIRLGFVGCLQKLKIDHVDLPLSGSSSVAVLQHLQDIDFHCRGSYIPGICSSAPCRNGGSCIPSGFDGYMCKCRSRFMGLTCDIDPNPCESNPCLNGGECEGLLNEYRCTCPGRLKGKRCELNRFCDPNLCKNNARCSDGINRPTCECPKGYQGDYCDRDIDECRHKPCSNGATCHNVLGGFMCNCTINSSGELCDTLVFSVVTSNAWNIRLEEIIGIIVAVVVLFLAALATIFLCRCHRRKQRRRSQSRLCKFDDELEKHPSHELENGGQKVALTLMNSIDRVPTDDSPNPSPIPPRIPERPASYAPRTADSYNTINTLNSDVARNYGSAADDLENAGTGRRSIKTPVFLQNCDAEKSPRAIRSLPKPPNDEILMDLNNLNKAENYRKNPKKLSKIMPNQSLQSLQLLRSGTSITSLPVSESEEDGLQSYHWDLSDMNPDNQLLLKMPPGSPGHVGKELNNRESMNMDEDLDGNESEYVGDSEFTENECENDEMDGGGGDHPHLSFRDILAMKDQLKYYASDESFEPVNRNYNLHPNDYLPEHDISLQSSQLSESGGGAGGGAGLGSGIGAGEEVASLNGNFNSADFICRDDDDDVIHYGFPSRHGVTSPSKYNRDSYTDVETDLEGGANVFLDNTSCSILSGGAKSISESMSDISGVCMIEDSEANASDDENTEVRKRLLPPSSASLSTMTQV